MVAGTNRCAFACFTTYYTKRVEGGANSSSRIAIASRYALARHRRTIKPGSSYKSNVTSLFHAFGHALKEILDRVTNRTT